MVKHLVLWNWTPAALANDPAALTAEIRTRFDSLLGLVEGLTAIEFRAGYKPGGHAIGLCCTFENAQDELAYQSNPLHQAIQAFTKPYFCDRAVIDYEV